jgi:hypothetical protein
MSTTTTLFYHLISHVIIFSHLHSNRLILQTNLIGSKNELHKTSISIDDVLHILFRGWVKVRRVSEFQSVSVDLVNALVRVPLRETPVITGAAGWV